MISAFYRKHSRTIIIAVLATFPFALWMGERLPCNNDIETWLPEQSASRATYDKFRATFGADEFVAIGYQKSRLDTQLVEALCCRMERLEGVKDCWSQQRLSNLMTELEVEPTEADERLASLVQSKDGDFHSILVIFDRWGVANRSEVVDSIRHQLDYCEVANSDVALSGAPVVVTELDRLGNRDNNKIFFCATLVVCLTLLHFAIRDWKMSLSIIVLTVWAIEVTLALLHVGGVEMNFILAALPILVTVFTLAVSIHFLHSFRDCSAQADPLSSAILAIWKPAVLATITTVIGLASLAISSIGPVQIFGISGAIGSVVALIAGLGVLPAVVVLLDYQPVIRPNNQIRTHRAGWVLVNHAKPITLVTLALVIACGVGLPRLSSSINPIEFLPSRSEAYKDIRTVERNLTSYDSLEVMVDFGVSEATIFDRIEEVQRIEGIIAGHPAVGHTMSLASFVPTAALNGEMPATKLIAQSRNQQNHEAFVADAERMWRISARLVPNARTQTAEVVAAIEAMTADAPITITGLTTVLDTAQHDIFVGFWESFASAFFLISLVVFFSLRSLRLGLLAMIPNLTPIAIVFGLMGWMDIPLDIGTMMTASISLGLAVDGTFHFLFAHRRIGREIDDPIRCSHQALCSTGMPILLTAVISGVGMLALTLSNFKPTAKFGFLMFALLLTALIGDLVLLPAILAMKRRRAESKSVVPDAHFKQLPVASGMH